MQQEERLLLAQSSLQSTQEQLSERVAEVVRLEQASRRLEAEQRALQEQLASSMDEVEQSRWEQLGTCQWPLVEVGRAQQGARGVGICSCQTP